MGRVVRFHELGGPEVLRIEPRELSAPKAGDVRIRVGAIGLNRVEAMFRSGWMGVPALPSTLGYEAAGVVEAIGEGVTGVAVGDRVATLPGLSMEAYGTYADQIFYPATELIPLPDEMSLEDGAASWMQYLTAYALVAVADLRAGEHVVITAASSSVGLAAIQIANLLGATPIAVTRGPGKVEALRRHGARHVVVSDAQDLAPAVLEITGGRGARVVFDAVGGDTVAALADATSARGIIIIYGALAGAVSPLPLQPAMLKSLTIRGFAMNDMVADAPVRRAAIEFVRQGFLAGQLKPVIDRVFELDDIAQAHRYLESNVQLGKIVVRTS